MGKIIVHSGLSVEDKLRTQMHPVKEVERARELIMELVEADHRTREVYSNNTDFVMAVKYIGKKHGVETEFFLNGVSYGDSIDEVFEDFNKSLDLINEWGATED